MAHKHSSSGVGGLNSGKGIPDDSRLHPSYGAEIPHVRMIKGEFVNFSELAGTGDITPRRNITFGDSISDNKRNQPKSH